MFSSISKNVYNVDTGLVEEMVFLRLNEIDSYNNNMGDVDLADQLRGSYRIDFWLRNRKWWWSIMFWAIGVILTNAYIVYKKVNEEFGVSKHKIMSQHDFRRQVAIAWINPKYYANANGDIVLKTGNKRTWESVSTLSTENTPANDNGKSVHVTNDSLCPLAGKLACRMDRDRNHLPVAKMSHASRCSMHRWAGGDEVYSNNMRCPTCRVHLCVNCYTPFHSDRELVANKDKYCPTKPELKKRQKTTCTAV